MDDVMGKLGELMSDEESVRQLSELAHMMKSEINGNEGDESEESSADLDMGKFMQIAGIISSASVSDKNAELLLALKPHLKAERQERVDRAVKFLKLIAVWNSAKESGLLKDIF